MAMAAAADPTDSASMEEAKPLYVAANHMDVDPFDDGYSYLLEWLIDSIWLMDHSTQWMIASVRSVLDELDYPMKGPEVEGQEESAATRSATQPLVTVTTESLAWKWQIRLNP
jgi:hypothetical protein